MKTAYNLAREVANNSRLKQGKYYDLKVRGVELQVGDRVLVKVVAFDASSKLKTGGRKNHTSCYTSLIKTYQSMWCKEKMVQGREEPYTVIFFCP